MNAFESGPAEIIRPKIVLEFKDLIPKIGMSRQRPAILDAARAAFDRVNGRWSPAAVYQWVEYKPENSEEAGTLIPAGGDGVTIRPGHANRFLAPALHALAGVYTAGREMDELSARASREGNFLATHFIDLTALAALEAVERRVKALAEHQAAETGWGVSPFLSPGSVHGWELEEQTKLAGLLPIDDIDVTLSESGVFSPFKTISCLIGIGPEYEARKVGVTCRVCSRRENCRMRQSESEHSKI